MERKRIIASAVIVFLLIPTVLWSQITEWTTYNVSNSQLPLDMIGPLVFDAQGNLWIGSGSLAPGSSAGYLTKFDGENWTVYNQGNSGLPHVTATGLASDGQRSTWIGTYGGGLAVLRSWPVVDFNGDGVVESR